MARFWEFGLAFLLLPVGGGCADNRWQSPVLGYLAGEDPLELRVMAGIPGAAIRGEPLPLPDGLTRIRLAPGHRFALAERGEAGPPAVLNLDGDAAPALAPLPGAVAQADAAVFSPSGRSVVLYSAREERLQVLTGLPGEPRVLRNFPVSAPAALAVSDDGETLLTADAEGTVYLAGAGGGTRPVWRASTLAGMAFLPNRAAAVACDGGRGEVFLLGGLDGASYSRVVATGLDGAGALRASSDGAAVFVAAREGNRLWRIDLASTQVRAFDVPAAPAMLEPLRLPDAFLISSPPGEPAWLFVSGGAEARSYFIPAAGGRTEP
jgi:hypothetical protein